MPGVALVVIAGVAGHLTATRWSIAEEQKIVNRRRAKGEKRKWNWEAALIFVIGLYFSPHLLSPLGKQGTALFDATLGAYVATLYLAMALAKDLDVDD